jgi:hypothetical protein
MTAHITRTIRKALARLRLSRREYKQASQSVATILLYLPARETEVMVLTSSLCYVIVLTLFFQHPLHMKEEKKIHVVV